MFIIAAIISEENQAVFDAAAFGLWAIALLSIARDVWERVRAVTPLRGELDSDAVWGE